MRLFRFTQALVVLNNYDANIIAVSPDGNTMFVADYGDNRIVCVEPSK
jgi:sugar lactone lactonase YvrE